MVPLGALAQEIRLGSELQVNTYTADDQNRPSVGAANGGFIVAWNSNQQDGPFIGVFARRFSIAGAPLASEFRVNTFTTFAQRHPKVATDASGRFVVVWMQDAPVYAVLARRFTSAGTALASEFQVNTYTPSYARTASVAVSADGDFVVAWDDSHDGSGYGVFARRFSSAGTPLAGEFQVNTYIESNQRYPSIGAAADGDLIVAWSSFGQDGSDHGIFARRFSSSGTALASEFQVNVRTLSYQQFPSVAADADGDFVVAWQSYYGDGGVYGIVARRFSSAGTAVASEFQVNTYTLDNQYRASVSMDADGVFVVAWESSGDQDGSVSGVFARRFSSAGLPQLNEFQVHTYTSGVQRFPAVAASADGEFLVAWESEDQDGSEHGVFAQLFAVPKTLDIDGNGTTEPLTDGLLALRYLFGFRGVTLVTGAFDTAGCKRCTVSKIETYLAAITLPQPLPEAIRLGSELQVNAFTANGQLSPSVAAEADGDFVVAWQSGFQDGSFNGIFARRFTSAGAPQAGEFQATNSTVFNQTRASVAADADGDFVVAWESDQIFARRFSSTGVALAGESQVNNFTTIIEAAPSVAVDADGDFVVVWESYPDGGGYGIHARRFSSSGGPLTGEFPVNDHVTGDQRNPSVAAEGDGDFLIAWSSAGQDGSANAVIARRFTSAGVALASELQVNTYITSSQYRPSVAVDADGDFVIAWDSVFQDGSSSGVFARRFASSGDGLASEFQINTYTTDFQSGPSLAADADGDFVVAWTSSQGGDPLTAIARRFSSAGAALASEFQVSAWTAGGQSEPSVTLDDHGRFLIAWHDSARDGASYGIFAQRFLGAVAPMDIDGNGSVEPLADGLLAVRYLFGFRGATLTTGVVGVGCMRCDAPAIEAYLAGLT